MKLIGYDNIGRISVINTTAMSSVGVISVDFLNKKYSVAAGDGGAAAGKIVNVLVTSWQLDQEANVEYMPTLTDKFYIYAFGHRAGKIAVSGFAGKSEGLDSIIQLFKEENVSSKKSGMPAKIVVGVTVLNGFLDSVSCESVQEIAGLHKFSFKFTTLLRGWSVEGAPK